MLLFNGDGCKHGLDPSHVRRLDIEEGCLS